MKKVRVLVFPCGTEIGLEIHNSLKFSRLVKLYGANSIPDHGKFVYRNYIEGVPFFYNRDFVKSIKRIVKEKNIDLIFPAHDGVIVKIVQEKSLHEKIITSPLKTCVICRSKNKTYKYFNSLLRVPKVYLPSDRNITFPVFLKPDIGQGTRGTHIADSYEDLKYYLKKDPTLLILEFLPNREYTVDCFTDRHGVLRFVGPRIRARISYGISVNSYPAENAKFEEIAQIINKNLRFRGVWFYQVKETKEKDLVLMEIAPRVGGSMGLTRNSGINLPLLAVYDALDMDILIHRNSHHVEIDRALITRFKVKLQYKHVYIDYDDTVLIDKETNPWIMPFLYQCINKKIKLHLLSRHQKTYGELVNESLNKHRLNQIFDEIINVSDEKEKHEYITKRNAIFIDDSFLERKKVSDALKIPVFDIHEVESLVDWKY